MADSGQFLTVKNGRGKASIWHHFGLQKHKTSSVITPNIAVCYRCDAVVKCSGGTTNLVTHNRRHHPMIISESSKRLPNSDELKRETVCSEILVFYLILVTDVLMNLLLL